MAADSTDYERPTTLADLVVKAVPATITVRDFPIHVLYNPDAVTTEALLAADRIQKDGVVAEMGMVTELLCNMIVQWDLREGPGGDVVALTAARLNKFGIGLLRDMLYALGGALNMGETSGTRPPQRSLRTPTKGRRAS